MDRPPFDPTRARGAPRDDLFGDSASSGDEGRFTSEDEGQATQITVGELARLIRTTVERRIASPLRVIGQVSNLSTRKHWYFSLKDEQAVVSCVAWASAARRFGFVPNDGDEVVATGHVGFYEPSGRLQLYVSALDPVGAGALQMQFRAMCEQLRARGLFDPERKRPTPVFPRRVAVITSASGAAVHDVISTARRRCPAVGLLVVDTRVQGEGAAAAIARAIRFVDRRREALGVDAILVTRGGGSMEDLWAFNEIVVAEATAACHLPIVAAIGHESDTTVIELVADARAATPTQAAMLLVPSRDELRQLVDHHAARLDALLRARLERARHRLRAVSSHELFRMPHLVIARHAERLRTTHRELDRAARHRVAAAHVRLERLVGRWARRPEATLFANRRARIEMLRHRLDRAVAARIRRRPDLERQHRRLDLATRRRVELAAAALDAQVRAIRALDPRGVLRRGFSYTTTTRGLVRGVGDVRGGDMVTTHLVDGTVRSRVEGRPRPRTQGPERDAPQLDLFEDAE